MIKNLLFFFVLFLLACEPNECTGLGREGVCIQVVNKSGQRVKKIVLIAPGHRRNMNRIVENNDETYFAYKKGGESSYRLLIILEDGDTLQSQEMYAEGGYTITETIEKDRVVSSYNDY